MNLLIALVVVTTILLLCSQLSLYAPPRELEYFVYQGPVLWRCVVEAERARVLLGQDFSTVLSRCLQVLSDAEYLKVSVLEVNFEYSEYVGRTVLSIHVLFLVKSLSGTTVRIPVDYSTTIQYITTLSTAGHYVVVLKISGSRPLTFVPEPYRVEVRGDTYYLHYLTTPSTVVVVDIYGFVLRVRLR